MLGHLFNRQYRPTYHSTVTAHSRLSEVLASWNSEPLELPWLQSMMSSYVFIIFNDIQVHDGRDTLGRATLWQSVHLFDRRLAGAKCLKYSWLSESVIVVAQGNTLGVSRLWRRQQLINSWQNTVNKLDGKN